MFTYLPPSLQCSNKMEMEMEMKLISKDVFTY